MKRWYIAGGAGSGKTTLAAELSAAYGVPHFDVDRGELPDDVDSAWIVEGAHIWDMDRFVRAADEVIWLDLPFRTTVSRILLRHLRLSARRANPHPGLRRLLQFVRLQPDYYRKPARQPTSRTDWDALSRAATAELIGNYAAEFVQLQSSRAVRSWRQSQGL